MQPGTYRFYHWGSKSFGDGMTVWSAVLSAVGAEAAQAFDAELFEDPQFDPTGWAPPPVIYDGRQVGELYRQPTRSEWVVRVGP